MSNSLNPFANDKKQNELSHSIAEQSVNLPARLTNKPLPNGIEAPVSINPNARKISNSEVMTWLSCRQQYAFAFGMNITPKITAKALARGTLGHLACQYYIEARLLGDHHEKAVEAGQKAFNEAIQHKIVPIDIAMETATLWHGYMGYHAGFPNWKFLGTEEQLDLAVTEDITIPIRYDLMVEEIDSGKVLIGDFKFTYNFWTPNEHGLNAQLPKYITVANYNGIKVDGGFLEEIRTRHLSKANQSDPKQKYRRTYYYPRVAKKRNMMRAHILASQEIVDYRQLTPDEQELKAIPVLNKHGACKFCNFEELCISKLDGKDITFDIEHGFTQNTYGYNNMLPTDDDPKELI